jgi:hypothetical protein
VGKRSILASLQNGIKNINSNIPGLVLKSGDEMPAVGLGLWKIPKDKVKIY